MLEKVIFLVGMPGAGKTTLGNSMQDQLENGESSIFIDDLSIQTNNARDYFQSLDTKNATQLIVADVFLCNEKTRNAATKIIQEVFPQVIVEEFFFENSPEKCIMNVEHRTSLGDDRKVLGLIKTLTKIYTIPEGAIVLEIKTGHSSSLKNKAP